MSLVSDVAFATKVVAFVKAVQASDEYKDILAKIPQAKELFLELEQDVAGMFPLLKDLMK